MRRLILLALLASVPHVAAAAADDAARWQVELDGFLTEPLPALRRVPRGFRIVTLSNLAEWYASRAKIDAIDGGIARQRLDAILALADSAAVSPYAPGKVMTVRLGHHGLYLSHYNIILAAHQAVHRSGRHRALSRGISRHLVQLSDNPWAHAPSYPGRAPRWPADQAALLFSLWLHDQAYGTQLADGPIARWLAVLQRKTSRDAHGLPVSEITGATRTSALPRGCALSFSVRYMAAFAPDAATQLWGRYRERYAVSLLSMMGLREWPPGVEGPIDVDSGPIVLGVGAAATGLGLGAARAVGDPESHRRLREAMDRVYALAPDRVRRIGDAILARSIAAVGLHLERWYDIGAAPHRL